jgi:glucokinase
MPGSESAARPPRVLGDVGGTNARFAWQDTDGTTLRDVATLPTADYPTIAAALRAYLIGIGRSAPPWCAVGIANPITGDDIRMTNSHWSFSIDAVRTDLGFERFVVINDFTALALALPDLPGDELRRVGGRAAEPGMPKALIGPGTGLGVSGLVPGARDGEWRALQGEGGHVTLAASNEREAAVLALLRDRVGHASAERAVSGRGLEALLETICMLDGAAWNPFPASEITRLALAGSDARCVEVVDLFCAFLGSVAGNLTLTLGARGGLYIGGGIVPRLGEAFDRSRFRACFEAKGRFSSYLEPIPAFVICSPISPALLGVARAL